MTFWQVLIDTIYWRINVTNGNLNQYSQYAHHRIKLHFKKTDPYQWGRFKVFDYGVLSDWQVELVATQDEPVVDGVSYQVDAGSHDKSDDAEVDGWARQRPRTALNQLNGAATHTHSVYITSTTS